ncbi:rCG39197 [Rattus norvegicus]|uniref:RCG39197 n=1 Tax=Rattus norvegicus TaxID=10116 RepID=A6KMH4_RAT|nr:rCG39197 [Rattus norvegicus]
MPGNCGPQLLWAAAAPRWDAKAKSTGKGSVPHTWSHVLQCEVLVRKAASVDGLPSRAIVIGEVASLHTECLVTSYHTAGRRAVGTLGRLPSTLSRPTLGRQGQQLFSD